MVKRLSAIKEESFRVTSLSLLFFGSCSHLVHFLLAPSHEEEIGVVFGFVIVDDIKCESRQLDRMTRAEKNVDMGVSER